MLPVLLLLLLPAAASDSPPADSTGLKFIVAFPENIAYYYPKKPQNKVQITALFPTTTVSFTARGVHQTQTLKAGETWEFSPDGTLELSKEELSHKTLQITSNKRISVHVVNLKDQSLQTALVTPADRLGTEYLVPPVPVINGTTHPADMVTGAVTERGPFKLLIVNTDQNNTATVSGSESKEVPLLPHQVAQIWVKQEEELKVKAKHPVAVLFGHTCARRVNCTCSQLYAALPPAGDQERRFYVPPVLAAGAEGETFVLLSEKESTKIQPVTQNSTLVRTAGSAVLYRPGLLLPLIPLTDFASCSVINAIPDAQNYALIVVHEDFKDGVHVKNCTLDRSVWQQLSGTEYVSAYVDLDSGKNVIWHPSSRMAVYLMGVYGDARFGNPAPVISRTPDFRGCAVSPEDVRIGDAAGGWRESLKYCKDLQMELVSFPRAEIQTQICGKIPQVNTHRVKEVWIGMRRSSQTGDWFWLSGDAVNHTHWGPGEPGEPAGAQCALMSLESGNSWSDEDCCQHAHPVCYRSPALFPL